MYPNRYPGKTVVLQRTVTALEAVQNSPTLGQLTRLIHESGQRLKAIEPLLPPAIRSSVQAGPIDGENWCLLVTGNAAAAKLRQLTPAIKSRLLDKGWKVTSIRLKILTGGR